MIQIFTLAAAAATSHQRRTIGSTVAGDRERLGFALPEAVFFYGLVAGLLAVVL